MIFCAVIYLWSLCSLHDICLDLAPASVAAFSHTRLACPIALLQFAPNVTFSPLAVSSPIGSLIVNLSVISHVASQSFALLLWPLPCTSVFISHGIIHT